MEAEASWRCMEMGTTMEPVLGWLNTIFFTVKGPDTVGIGLEHQYGTSIGLTNM
jgi:hypothetical protein